MKYYPTLLFLLATACATLAFGVLSNLAAAFIAQIFFVVFLLLFAATLETSTA
jgi:uncharacterized membrane protein YtjA (UPF0391 family)